LPWGTEGVAANLKVALYVRLRLATEGTQGARTGPVSLTSAADPVWET